MAINASQFLPTPWSDDLGAAAAALVAGVDVEEGLALGAGSLGPAVRTSVAEIHKAAKAAATVTTWRRRIL